jgi:hypothetical protein
MSYAKSVFLDTLGARPYGPRAFNRAAKAWFVSIFGI